MSSPMSLESLIHSNRFDEWDDIHPMFGDVFFSLDGLPLFRGDWPSDEFRQRRPALLDNKQTVCGDLIPETSWGASLYNLLTSTSWNGLRLPLLERNHYTCECCGIQRKTLEAHEIWECHFPDQDEIDQCRENNWLVMGVQKLVRLISVCEDCHLCFHLGYANSIGKLDQTLDRLRALNKWTNQQIIDYEQLVFERWNQANEFHWQLDFSNVQHPLGGLVINSQWKIHPDSVNFLTRINKFGDENLTVLLNTPWRFSKESDWRKANPYP